MRRTNPALVLNPLSSVTDHDATNRAFVTLGTPGSSRAACRQALARLTDDWTWLMVRYDHRDADPKAALLLAQGFHHAAVTAPRYSHTAGLMAVAWEKMYARAGGSENRQAQAELIAVVQDPRLKHNSPLARVAAANVNFHGMIWRPDLWVAGKQMEQAPEAAKRFASVAFCVLARRAMRHLPAGDPLVRNLTDRLREQQQTWRPAAAEDSQP